MLVFVFAMYAIVAALVYMGKCKEKNCFFGKLSKNQYDKNYIGLYYSAKNSSIFAR